MNEPQTRLSRPPGERQSNMELLRTVAMFMVLAVHANYPVFGRPDAADTAAFPTTTFFRLWEESLTLVCVNTFVLISGFFGIRPTWKGVCALLFQIGFYILLIHAALYAMGEYPPEQWKWKDILNGVGEYWFAGAYLGLMLLSPALNSFLQKITDSGLRKYLTAFYAATFIFGWLFENRTLFAGGYSVLSFAGLYLLGACIRRETACGLSVRRRYYLMSYLGITALSAACMWLILRFVPSESIQGYSFNILFLPYTSPQTLAGSVCLLLFFSGLHLQNRWINRTAVSVFAVYLVHTHDLVFPYYRSALLHLHASTGTPVFAGLAFTLLVAVFAVCLVIDRIRLAFWRMLWK